MNPLVSVVIPAYNEEKYIRQSIDSIIQQTYTNWEIIIVDDASTDCTRKIALDYQCPRIHIYTCPSNKGPGAAQNIGFSHSRGGLIAVLAGDDQAMPDRLSTQVEYMMNNPDVAVLGTGYVVIDEYGVTINTVKQHSIPLEIKWNLLFSNPIAAPTVILRSKAIRECGQYDQSIRFGEDMELWGRIASNWNIATIPTPLIKYRVHAHSLTNTTGFKLKQYYAGIVVQKNIQSLTKKIIENDVAELLASWLVTPYPNSRISNTAIDVILKCLLYFENNYCTCKNEYSLIRKHARNNIFRLIRLYGIKWVCIKTICNGNNRLPYSYNIIRLLMYILKAQLGYMRQKSKGYFQS